MGDGKATDWVLMDWHDVLTEEGIYPSVEIESLAHLRDELHRYSSMSDRIIALQSEQAQLLAIIGIGRTLGGIRVYYLPDIYTCQCAVAETGYSTEELGFMCEGQPSYFGPRHLLPIEKVISTVLDLYRLERLPGQVKWEPFA